MAEGSIGNRIQRGMEAFNAGDHDAVLDLLTDDVAWKRVDGRQWMRDRPLARALGAGSGR